MSANNHGRQEREEIVTKRDTSEEEEEAEEAVEELIELVEETEDPADHEGLVTLSMRLDFVYKSF